MSYCGCHEQILHIDEEAGKEAMLCSDSPGSELKGECVCTLLLKSNLSQKGLAWCPVTGHQAKPQGIVRVPYVKHTHKHTNTHTHTADGHFADIDLQT